MKKTIILMGVLVFVLVLTACATVKVDNLIHPAQPIGKIEVLAIKVESGFTLKEEIRLKKAVADELFKNGFKVKETSDILLEIEIEDILINSGSPATFGS